MQNELVKKIQSNDTYKKIRQNSLVWSVAVIFINIAIDVLKSLITDEAK